MSFLRRMRSGRRRAGLSGGWARKSLATGQPALIRGPPRGDVCRPLPRAERTLALFLGFDLGTQGTKGLVLDAEKATVVGRASTACGLIEGLPPGAAEQHPDTWIAAVRVVAAQLRAQVPDLAARAGGVGVSGQQHGLVVLDESGAVIRPAKLWCDTSSSAEAAELSAATGRRIPTGFTASKILWLRRHEEKNWRRVKRVLLPPPLTSCSQTSRESVSTSIRSTAARVSSGESDGVLHPPPAPTWRIVLPARSTHRSCFCWRWSTGSYTSTPVCDTAYRPRDRFGNRPTRSVMTAGSPLKVRRSASKGCATRAPSRR